MKNSPPAGGTLDQTIPAGINDLLIEIFKILIVTNGDGGRFPAVQTQDGVIARLVGSQQFTVSLHVDGTR